MSVKYPETFKSFPPANFDGLFDWDFLLPAFQGTNIEPMDIDAVIERRGKVLLFETKSEGKEIPLGQRITLDRLIILGRGNIHLMILYSKTTVSIVAMDEWSFSKGQVRRQGIVNCDAQFVLERVIKWFQWANIP